MLNKLYGEKAVHVKAYEFYFKPKQQEYAVSSIGVMEDLPLCMFATRGFAPLIRGFAPFQIFTFFFFFFFFFLGGGGSHFVQSQTI